MALAVRFFVRTRIKALAASSAGCLLPYQAQLHQLTSAGCRPSNGYFCRCKLQRPLLSGSFDRGRCQAQGSAGASIAPRNQRKKRTLLRRCRPMQARLIRSNRRDGGGASSLPRDRVIDNVWIAVGMMNRNNRKFQDAWLPWNGMPSLFGVDDEHQVRRAAMVKDTALIKRTPKCAG